MMAKLIKIEKKWVLKSFKILQFLKMIQNKEFKNRSIGLKIIHY